MEKIRNKTYSLLRRSESFFKTDMVYLAKGGGWLTLGQIVTSLSSFAIAIAFANLLSPETYGAYKYVLSIVGILTITTLSGVNTAISQAVSRGIEGVLHEGLLLKIKWGLAGTAGSLIIAIYYYINGNNELALIFLATAPFIPFYETLGVYSSYLSGKKLFKESIAYFTLIRIGYVSALIGAMLMTNSILFLLIANLGVFALLNSIFLLHVLRSFPPNTKKEVGIILRGKHISIVGIVGKVSQNLDSLLLFHYFGPLQVAIYAFARAPVEQIRSACKIIMTLSLPKLSNRPSKEINHLLLKRTLLLLLSGLFIGGGYILIAPYVFHALFPQYLSAIFYSQLLAILLILQLPLALITSVVQSRLHLMPTSWIYMGIITRVVYIVMLIILIARYGIIGAVISQLVLQILQSISAVVLWRILAKKDQGM